MPVDSRTEEEPESDRLIPREWRIGLVLLGIAALAGGILFGLKTMLVLGISYAHDSSPTAEFRAAGDAKMWLALLLAVFGIACLACRRRKHALPVALLGLATLACAGIAAWLDERSDQAASAGRGYAIPVEPAVPPPTIPTANEQAR